ncbi:MAG: DUF3793 family protein [Oscillospiraceae bacterium]|nr:DUF3793 family protein [Oscillospiraceae bacterium]
MSEEAIVRNCAPTLAGIKTGNLFSYPYRSAEEMRTAVRHWNRILRDKGVRIVPLRFEKNRALIYVYRPSHLSGDLKNKDAAAILTRFGYPAASSGQCIVQLIRRLRETAGFPHEIGLFLGYPPEDVTGFIEHRSDCRMTGCWKVYGDVQKCSRLFSAYKRCIRSCEAKLHRGVPVPAMTVAE